jgi:hypothetical protein
MERDELERWLCGPDVAPAPPCVIATALGLAAGSLADTTLLRTAARVRTLRLTLAVLRDAFANDDDMSAWLETPHDALDGAAPCDAIIAGREADVLSLAVEAWNDAACVTGMSGAPD